MAMEPFVKTSKALTNALVKVAAAVEIRVKEGIFIFTLTLSEGTRESKIFTSKILPTSTLDPPES